MYDLVESEVPGLRILGVLIAASAGDPGGAGCALDCMLTDEILASRTLTLPDFAKVIDQLLASSYARPPSDCDGIHRSVRRLRVDRARQLLERVVRRDGRDQRSGELDELAASDTRFVKFIDRVVWMTLCDEPVQDIAFDVPIPSP